MQERIEFAALLGLTMVLIIYGRFKQLDMQASGWDFMFRLKCRK